MCSTRAARIARVCRAIEELSWNSSERGGEPTAAAAAAQPRDAAQPGHRAAVTGEGSSAGAAGDDMAARLAAIWAMIADIDPELARRLPGYLGTVD